jgi:hypothetical protein
VAVANSRRSLWGASDPDIFVMAIVGTLLVVVRVSGGPGGALVG